MVKRSLALALVVVFLIATVAAVFATLYAYQQPIETVETTTLANYRQVGTYSYVAELFPNILYNTSTLYPGQGTLYEPILSNVSMTFNYSFSSSPSPTNTSETHYVKVEFSSSKWTKQLTATETFEWLGLNVSERDFTIFFNVTQINQIFKTIDLETASSGGRYNITVSPFIFQRATIEGRQVYEVFNPKITIMFLQDGVRYVDISPLNTVNQKSITESVTIRNNYVETLRTASLIGALVSAPLFIVSLILYFKSQPLDRKKTIDKLVSPHKEMIVDTSEVPPVTRTVIEISSLDDLARTAEVLARPIMHSVTGDEHTFFIIDGETRYQFKTIS